MTCLRDLLSEYNSFICTLVWVWLSYVTYYNFVTCTTVYILLTWSFMWIQHRYLQ